MTKLDRLEQKIEKLERRLCCKTQFFDTVDDLPAEGSTGVIYVTEDGNIYVWNGTEYILNGLGDAYYTNSYVERLKALGSNVQYSNYVGSTVTSASLVDEMLRIQSIYIPKTSIITNIGWKVGSIQGNYTADNYNGIGLYSMNIATGDLTLLAKTANDANIWSNITIFNYGNKNLETPVTLTKGIYFIAYLYNSSAQVAAPSISSNVTSGFVSSSDMATFNVPANTFLGGYVSTQTTLPLTILSTSVTKVPLIELIWYLN